MGRAAAGRALPVADRPVHGGDRPAVPGGVGQRAAAAGLVRAHRPSARARSLLPVRGQQPRQPDRAAGLSVRAGAGVRPERAEPHLGVRLRAARDLRWRVVLPDARRAGRRRAGNPGRARRRAGRDALRAPTWGERLGWVGLALVPSALLTAFTTHVTTDVASAPLLWVLPLSLYLLTFVLVFRERPLIPRESLLFLHLDRAGRGAARAVADQARELVRHRSTGVAVFFTSAMVAHRTLYEARPAPPLSHRVLSVDVARRRARRPVRGADRAEDLQRGVRVSAAAGAVDGLPAGRARTLLRATRQKQQGRADRPVAGRAAACLCAHLGAAGALSSGIAVGDGARRRWWSCSWWPCWSRCAARRASWWRRCWSFARWCGCPPASSAAMRSAATSASTACRRRATAQYHTLIHGTTLHGAQRIRDDERQAGRRYHARHLLLRGQPDGADHRQACASGWATAEGPLRHRRAGRRVARLPLSAKARPGASSRSIRRDRHRQQPEHFTFLSELPARARHRDRRRAADHGQGAERQLRPDHRRRVLLRRRARAPDDGGGDAALPRQGEARRHRAAAHLQPLSRPRLGAGRDHQGAAGAHGRHHLSDDTADGSYAQSTSTVALFAKSEEALEPFRKLEPWWSWTPAVCAPGRTTTPTSWAPFMSKIRGDAGATARIDAGAGGFGQLRRRDGKTASGVPAAAQTTS